MLILYIYSIYLYLLKLSVNLIVLIVISLKGVLIIALLRYIDYSLNLNKVYTLHLLVLSISLLSRTLALVIASYK